MEISTYDIIKLLRNDRNKSRFFPIVVDKSLDKIIHNHNNVDIERFRNNSEINDTSYWTTLLGLINPTDSSLDSKYPLIKHVPCQEIKKKYYITISFETGGSQPERFSTLAELIDSIKGRRESGKKEINSHFEKKRIDEVHARSDIEAWILDTLMRDQKLQKSDLLEHIMNASSISDVKKIPFEKYTVQEPKIAYVSHRNSKNAIAFFDDYGVKFIPYEGLIQLNKNKELDQDILILDKALEEQIRKLKWDNPTKSYKDCLFQAIQASDFKIKQNKPITSSIKESLSILKKYNKSPENNGIRDSARNLIPDVFASFDTYGIYDRVSRAPKNSKESLNEDNILTLLCMSLLNAKYQKHRKADDNFNNASKKLNNSDSYPISTDFKKSISALLSSVLKRKNSEREILLEFQTMTNSQCHTDELRSLVNMMELAIKTDRVSYRRISRYGIDEEARPSRNKIYFIRGEDKSFVAKQGNLDELVKEGMFIKFTNYFKNFAKENGIEYDLTKIAQTLVRNDLEKKENLNSQLLNNVFEDSEAILLLEQGRYDSFETLKILRTGKDTMQKDLFSTLEEKLINKIITNSAYVLAFAPVTLAYEKSAEFKEKWKGKDIKNYYFERYTQRFAQRIKTSIKEYLGNEKLIFDKQEDPTKKNKKQNDLVNYLFSNRFDEILTKTTSLRKYLSNLTPQFYTDAWWGNNLDELVKDGKRIQLKELEKNPDAIKEIDSIDWKVYAIDFGSVNCLPLAIDYATIAVVDGFITPKNEDAAMRTFFKSYNDGVLVFNKKVSAYEKNPHKVIIDRLEDFLANETYSKIEKNVMKNFTDFLKGKKARKKTNPIKSLTDHANNSRHSDKISNTIDELNFHINNLIPKETLYNENNFEEKFQEFKISCYAAMFQRGWLFASAHGNYMINKGNLFSQRTVDEVYSCISAAKYGLTKFIEYAKNDSAILDNDLEAIEELENANKKMEKMLDYFNFNVTKQPDGKYQVS